MQTLTKKLLIGGATASVIGGGIVGVTSDTGVKLIQEAEGLRTAPYYDAAGIRTVCYGHTSNSTGKIQERVYTNEECTLILIRDLHYFEDIVNRKVKVPMTQLQFDALVSFVYNVGEGNFSRSTLLKYLNQGKYCEASQQFEAWTKITVRVNGRTVKRELAGLKARRKQEKEMFQYNLGC